MAQLFFTKTNRSSSCLVILIFSLFLGCSPVSDEESRGVQKKATPYVIWDQVPDRFNPIIIEEKVGGTLGARRILLNFFDFDKDIQFQFSEDLSIDEIHFSFYQVSFYNPFKSLSGAIEIEQDGERLIIKKTGPFECRLDDVDGEIQFLKGGCYVRIIVYLHPDSLAEVYNERVRISPKLYPADLKQVIEDLENSTLASKQLQIIKNYSLSYLGVPISQYLAIDGFKSLMVLCHSRVRLQVLQELLPVMSDYEAVFNALPDFFEGEELDQAMTMVNP